ncbi:MAG: MCP four helix bundle domain-containing protein [Bacteroidota bacterium]
MKWRLSTAQKIRTGIAFVVVFLLIIATNAIDNQRFETIQQSVQTMYKDRLVGKSYLYKISRQLQIKREILQSQNAQPAARLNAAVNDSIKVLIDQFSETKLTQFEEKRLRLLQKNLDQLLKEEKSFSTVNSNDEAQALPTDFELYFSRMIEDLDALAEIQLDEGKREKMISNRAVNASNIISKIEIGFLILIGVIIQLLIFVKPLK